MASKKKADGGSEAQVEPTFQASYIARVNKEGDHHEVILRAESGGAQIVLRNQRGAGGFRNGHTYDVLFMDATPEPEAAEAETDGDQG